LRPGAKPGIRRGPGQRLESVGAGRVRADLVAARQQAFVANYGNGIRPIAVMNHDGSDLRVITPGRHAFVPAWQPIP
jgi:hypothetical protein